MLNVEFPNYENSIHADSVEQMICFVPSLSLSLSLKGYTIFSTFIFSLEFKHKLLKNQYLRIENQNGCNGFRRFFESKQATTLCTIIYYQNIHTLTPIAREDNLLKF